MLTKTPFSDLIAQIEYKPDCFNVSKYGLLLYISIFFIHYSSFIHAFPIASVSGSIVKPFTICILTLKLSGLLSDSNNKFFPLNLKNAA